MPLYLAGQVISDSNLNANGAQVDNTVYSGTPTSLTQFSNLWDIPSGTTTGNGWRLTIVGMSTMGTTALAQTFAIGYGANGATSATIITTGSTAQPVQPASCNWYFTVIIWLIVSTGGSGGRAFLMGQVRGGEIPNNTSINWTFGMLPVSINFATDTKLCFLTDYSASTGTPLCTVSCSVLEKLG